jgi:hypothetical protein
MIFVNPNKRNIIQNLCFNEYSNLKSYNRQDYTFENNYKNDSNKNDSKDSLLIINDITNFYRINNNIYINNFQIKNEMDLNFENYNTIDNIDDKNIILYIEDHEYKSFKKFIDNKIINNNTVNNITFINMFLSIQNFFDMINYNIKYRGIVYLPLNLKGIKSTNSKLTDKEFFIKNKDKILTTIFENEFKKLYNSIDSTSINLNNLDLNNCLYTLQNYNNQLYHNNQLYYNNQLYLFIYLE